MIYTIDNIRGVRFQIKGLISEDATIYTVGRNTGDNVFEILYDTLVKPYTATDIIDYLNKGIWVPVN